MPDIPEAVRRQARRSNSSGPRSVFSFGDDRSDLESEFKSRARLIAALRKASAPQTAAKKKDDVQKAAKTPAGEQVAMGSDAKPVAIPPDAGEPSLAALAQLIQEVSFLHIWRRAYFERCTLDCSTDLFLKVAIPLVADHPLRPFLESFAWDVAKYREAMDRASRLTPDGLELHAYQILSDLRRCHLEAGNAMYRAMYNHSDDLARDFAVLCRIFPNKPSALAMYARNLLEISPHSPLAKTFLVDARVASKSQLAEWKSLAAKYPALANALAGYSDEAKQWDDAIRYCQMAIEIVDDKGMYEFLAELYLKKKDEGRWLKTLEAALQLPDRGLDHSEIQRRIADHFMNKKEWKRALPHALAAAESYSGAGLNCASRCYEGLGEWKKAEQYLQAKGERYRSSSLDWYYFCRRTGKGDLQAARELAESFLNDPSAHTAEEISFCAVEFYLLEKQVEKALAVYRRSFAEKPDPFFGLWVAILADELQNPKTRDAALERIRVKGPSYVRKDVGRVRTELIEVAAWITRDLARGGKGEIARQDMDKVLVPIKGSYEMAYAYMFLARYLESHGKREEAVRCWKKNVVPTDGPHIARYLAIAALNDLGIKVDDQSPSAVEEPKSNAKTSPLTSKADKNAGQRKTNQKEAKEASKAVPQGPQKDDDTRIRRRAKEKLPTGQAARAGKGLTVARRKGRRPTPSGRPTGHSSTG